MSPVRVGSIEHDIVDNSIVNNIKGLQAFLVYIITVISTALCVIVQSAMLCCTHWGLSPRRGTGGGGLPLSEYDRSSSWLRSTFQNLSVNTLTHWCRE